MKASPGSIIPAPGIEQIKSLLPLKVQPLQLPYLTNHTSEAILLLAGSCSGVLKYIVNVLLLRRLKHVMTE